MSYSRIIGTGSYLPTKILTNHDLEKMVDTTDEWIRERTGIEQRHIAAEGEKTADLAEHAARQALEASGKSPDDIGLIIVATCTHDSYFPSTAIRVQRRLGIKGGPAFDVNAACSGFIYGLDIADKYIRAGEKKCALVVGAERMTAIVDWTQRDTCVLFGDGAGAVVLEPSDEEGIISTHVHADGHYEDLLYSDLETHKAVMKGNEVFRVAVRTLERIVDETLEANNLDKSAVDWLIPHQANLRIIAATAKKLSLPLDQVVITVGQHGNTSSASIPLAFDIAVRDGRIQRGQTLLMEAFGAGFTWGSALIRY